MKTAAEIAAEKAREQQTIAVPAETQRLRTVAQGATFGWAEEVEAAVRSLVPGGPEYSEIRDDLRQKLNAYKQENPGEALTMELVGAIAPAVLTLGRSLPLSAPQAIRSVGSALRQPSTYRGMAGRGAAEGAVAATGFSEREGLRSLAEAPGGALAGMVINPLSTLAMRKVMDVAKAAFGPSASTMVQAELLRLAEGTGKTVDEIVDDIANGRIMAENRTLEAVVRAYKSGGGQAGAYITEQVPLRRGETRSQAMGAVQEGLAPASESNVIRGVRRTDDELKRLENEGYTRVFSQSGDIPQSIQQRLLDALQRFPELRSSLAQVYSESDRLVPLFNVDETGALAFTRMPTLEDAHTVYRQLREMTQQRYQAGAGQSAQNSQAARDALINAIDSAFPDYKAVRTLAHRRRTVAEAFEEGRKALAKNADEVDLDFEQILSQGDDVAQAYRAGVMDAINNKARRSPSLMNRLADPERQEGAVLRVVFPGQNIEDVARKLDIASDAQTMSQRVMYGSPTAPEQAARSAIGSRISGEEVLGAAMMNPMMLIGVAQKALADAMPALNDRQKLEIAQVLFSQNPDLVRKALTDRTAMQQLSQMAAQLATTLGYGARTATTQQAAQGIGGPVSGGLLAPQQ